MKTLFLIVALLFTVTLTSAPSIASKESSHGKKQKAVAQFPHPVQLLGVTLKGEYLFVHDEAAMMRGEACTFVYKGNAEIASKLVISFRCVPEQRQKVGSFTMRMDQLSPGVSILREYQFKGDAEAHVVPVPGASQSHVIRLAGS